MTVTKVNQKDYGPGNVPTNAFCLASCYLCIANFYKANKKMENLITEKIVNSSGSVLKWGDYFTRGAIKSYNASDISGIKAAIDKSNPVIIKGNSNSSTHYVVAYDYSGSTIKVMDPWGGVTGNLGSTTLKSATDYYICTK